MDQRIRRAIASGRIARAVHLLRTPRCRRAPIGAIINDAAEAIARHVEQQMGRGALPLIAVSTPMLTPEAEYELRLAFERAVSKTPERQK